MPPPPPPTVPVGAFGSATGLTYIAAPHGTLNDTSRLTGASSMFFAFSFISAIARHTSSSTHRAAWAYQMSWGEGEMAAVISGVGAAIALRSTYILCLDATSERSR